MLSRDAIVTVGAMVASSSIGKHAPWSRSGRTTGERITSAANLSIDAASDRAEIRVRERQGSVTL